ncbi:DUF2155 domain-containing protein [Erythrobacter sp. EC-HK427]|uniref:DUF2155 domain-containing protein n=1 Tax=Erythrobacter sp. EC-HK427 TaxID=2038396 RepID=UPI0012556E0E|nr:DUF2155 domain-containing protein [Erythrobacter sp. EC-HK427]VVT06504.1 conserved exported hypothetical protein [Erythrobacter sp. EC-HK427]
MRGTFALLAAVAALAACGGEAPEPVVEETGIPEELARNVSPEAAERAAEAQALGTPMAERVATIGLVNKRNNDTRDLEMRPGEQQRIDNVIIRLAACERTAPWEDPQQTGAFVQVLVNERPAAGEEPQWVTVFSGWLFKESPSLNVVEHPVYDVWVKDCAMSFPGEEDAPDAPASEPAAEEA